MNNDILSPTLLQILLQKKKQEYKNKLQRLKPKNNRNKNQVGYNKKFRNNIIYLRMNKNRSRLDHNRLANIAKVNQLQKKNKKNKKIQRESFQPTRQN